MVMSLHLGMEPAQDTGTLQHFFPFEICILDNRVGLHIGRPLKSMSTFPKATIVIIRKQKHHYQIHFMLCQVWINDEDIIVIMLQLIVLCQLD